MTMSYLLDSNIYMDCYDRYYLQDCFPGFWTAFTPMLDKYVVAADVMLNEHQNSEWFVNWFKSHYHLPILKCDDYVDDWGNVLNYVHTCGKYKDTALSGDRGWANPKIADPWLIAMACKNNFTLVTSELPDINLNQKGHKSKAAKIPDVSEAFGVRVIDRNSFFHEVKLVV